MPGLDLTRRKLDLSEPVELADMKVVFRKVATLFDAYIFVDWSAASDPKTGEDSIWIGAGAYDSTGILVVNAPTNPSTRREAEIQVREMLHNCIRLNQRVLIGFDFPYGYPAGWHTALGITIDGDWRALWNLLVDRVSDDARNRNNRCDVANGLNAAVDQFVGPYWTNPNVKSGMYPALPPKKPACFETHVREFREIALHLKKTGKSPKSVWQLFGTGVVGSQSMLGIPVLHRLRNDRQLRTCSQVWPFETGWQCPSENRPFILHAEIWPGAITVKRALHAVKDAAQILSYVYWAARLDVAGALVARFNPAPAVALPLVVQKCEGWILGD